MLGYHLEQAARFNDELGRPDGGLAQRSAARLGAAGLRALDRGDMVGAINLLGRATALLPVTDAARIELEIELGEALHEAGRLTEAESLLEQTAVHAALGDQPLIRVKVQLGLAAVRIQTSAESERRTIRRELEQLVAVFEEADDHRDAANALRLLGVLTPAGPDAAALQERALVHAHAAGDERLAQVIARHIAAIALWGPEPVEPALARCRAILGDASVQSRGLVQASCLMRIGGLEGLAGRFDAARSTIGRARAIMDELGLHHQKAHSTDVAALVEILAEDYEAAEREARHAYLVLTEMGDVTYRASEALLLAQALELQGRADEADEWLATAGSIDDYPDDPDALVIRARLLAQRGHLEEAARLAQSALDRGVEVAVPFVDARFTLAEILIRSGRHAEAAQAAEECLHRYEAKGIVPLIQKAKALLAEISAHPRSTPG